MPLQTTHPLTDPSGNYRDELLTFLTIKEGFKDGRPYIDLLPRPAVATIGYGFNIETVSAYMALTLNQLGILGNKTAGETQQILGSFIVQATAAQRTSDLQARLTNLAQQYGVPEFKIDQTQATTIYTQILSGATIAVTGGSPIDIQGKEARLDFNLGNSLAHDTKEYVALMSLFYNAESLVGAGSKLATAVINDSRAEAWYEIRYRSNGDQLSGIATRRYDEAKLFGLYNGPIINPQPTDAEAKAIYKMYTTHRNEILAYEGNPTFAPTTHGALAFKGESFLARNLLLTTFAIFADAPVVSGEVLVGSNIGNRDSVPGNDLLLGENRYNIIHGQGGDDIIYGGNVGDDLFGDGGADFIFGGLGDDVLQGEEENDTLEGGPGKDRLVGGAGDDTLRGGIGDDKLTGRAGDDILEGGEGDDTYYINSLTDGNDTIEDSDATGVIKVDGRRAIPWRERMAV
jgi:GH24 family phage-related lysozyme (muramidase)